MEESISEQQKQLCAVVTGSNKGIGLATVHLLTQQGFAVVLTARDEKRRHNAVEILRREFGLSNVLFHQLDVRDPISVANLAQFIKTQVNNAGANGVLVDQEKLKALYIDPETWLSGKAVVDLIQEAARETYDGAVVCLGTNYYGCKRVIEALLSLLQLSSSGARIVDVSSVRSELKLDPALFCQRENVAMRSITVVTGASKGIGLAIVHLLTQQGGVTVILIARDEQRGLDTVELLRQECDLSSVERC